MVVVQHDGSMSLGYGGQEHIGDWVPAMLAFGGERLESLDRLLFGGRRHREKLKFRQPFVVNGHLGEIAGGVQQLGHGDHTDCELLSRT
jgi:hypothetical protein